MVSIAKYTLADCLGQNGALLCNACGIRYARGHTGRSVRPKKPVVTKKSTHKINGAKTEEEPERAVTPPAFKRIDLHDFLVDEVQVCVRLVVCFTYSTRVKKSLVSVSACRITRQLRDM